jgi:hypothetical protein
MGAPFVVMGVPPTFPPFDWLSGAGGCARAGFNETDNASMAAADNILVNLFIFFGF